MVAQQAALCAVGTSYCLMQHMAEAMQEQLESWLASQAAYLRQHEGGSTQD